jgi:hypothetical protein
MQQCIHTSTEWNLILIVSDPVEEFIYRFDDKVIGNYIIDHNR